MKNKTKVILNKKKEKNKVNKMFKAVLLTKNGLMVIFHDFFPKKQ